MTSTQSVDSLPVIVIGGGAAGMIAAWRAGTSGVKAILLEKNAKLGIKLLISGGGKCNITHGGTMETLRHQFKTNEARFLKHSFYQFTNADILDHLGQLGVATYARDDGRVFPTSGKAGDVVHALRRMMERAGVEIRVSTPVEEIVRDRAGACGVRTLQELISSRQIILSTGGSSYPKTGTTGDGFVWARNLGHSIVPLRPALAPLYLDPAPPAEWHGVAIRDCVLKANSNSQTIAKWRGDLLFTHQGVSGPAALEVSRDVYPPLEKSLRVDAYVDVTPEESELKLEKHVQQEVLAHGARSIETLVELFVPHRLAPFILDTADIDGSKKRHQLEKDERRTLVQTLKGWNIGRVKEIPLERGEVTAGGIELREVDPKTMRSRTVNGLYICGEVLDISGPVGGYNLQAAFSTGYVAGETAANDWKNDPTGR
jgi:hypothetical protein